MRLPVQGHDLAKRGQVPSVGRISSADQEALARPARLQQLRLTVESLTLPKTRLRCDGVKKTMLKLVPSDSLDSLRSRKQTESIPWTEGHQFP
jgi:hypothetical protein